MVKTICASTEGTETLELMLPGEVKAKPATVSIRVVAGRSAGKSGIVTVDNVAIEGDCTPVSADCGGSCPAGLSCNSGSGACAYHVVISEIATASASGAGDEFVELYNPGDAPAAIGGLLLEYGSSTGTTWSSKIAGGFASGVMVAAHGYYLVASNTYTSSTVPDLKLSNDLAFAGAAGAVRLATSTGVAIDLLGYGAATTRYEGASGPGPAASSAGTWSVERKASALSTAGSMATGGVDASAGNGYDSDNNAADFVLRTARDPQSSKSTVEPAP